MSGGGLLLLQQEEELRHVPHPSSHGREAFPLYVWIQIRDEGRPDEAP